MEETKGLRCSWDFTREHSDLYSSKILTQIQLCGKKNPTMKKANIEGEKPTTIRVNEIPSAPTIKVLTLGGKYRFGEND